MRSSLRVLLDSTYLLPCFGIEVEGLSDEDLAKLRDLKLRGLVEYFATPIVWIEILGKVYREAMRRRRTIDRIVSLAIRTLVESEYVTWINPGTKALEIAYSLRVHGHRDMIDNILYGLALEKNLLFLTMDRNLIDFLSRHGFDTNTVLDHRQLFNMVSLSDTV